MNKQDIKSNKEMKPVNCFSKNDCKANEHVASKETSKEHLIPEWKERKTWTIL